MAQAKKSVEIIVAKEVDGLEMGVMEDGTAYLTGRALARVCGVQPSAIIHQEDLWALRKRDGMLARMLLAAGMGSRQVLFIPYESPTGPVHAYPDDVCMVFLEYYAFNARGEQNATALDSYKRFARAGMRLFVYKLVGYDPARAAEESWKAYQERHLLNTAPLGYFSVFHETAQMIVTAIKHGLVVDSHTVPDDSVGQIWATHWKKNALEAKYGPSQKHKHRYPESFPQAQANEYIEANVYPKAALGEFHLWLEAVYMPHKFPTYLERKAKRGMLDAPTMNKILAAFESPPALPKKAS